MTAAGDRMRTLVREVLEAGHLQDLTGGAAHPTEPLRVLLDADVDWTDPRCPVVDPRAVRLFEDDEPWSRVAADRPEWINVAAYGIRGGGEALVVSWSAQPVPHPADPAISLSTAPAGVDIVTRGGLK
jgi:hypothetical protein